MKKRLRVDLHVHTFYSHDSLLRPETLVAACLAKGLNCIAVTDHNEIDGARAVQRMAPFKVIVGEEIRTREGEITGLFLKERIPPNLGVMETVREIRRQKGLVYLPHPFATAVPVRLKRHALELIGHEIDIVEGFNSRGILHSDDHRAQLWALERGKPFAAGSDAHTRFEVGSAWMEIDEFRSPRGLVKALLHGMLSGRKNHLLYPAASVAVGRAKVLAGHRSEAAREKRRTKIHVKGMWTE